MSMVDPQPKTEELKLRQAGQEVEERALEADSDTSAEADSHRRRADKAQYLREKLEQRAESERQAAREDD
jgi:hypothetical protein